MPLGFEATDRGTMQVMLMPHARDIPLCLDIPIDTLQHQIDGLNASADHSSMVSDWEVRLEDMVPFQQTWVANAIMHLAQDSLGRLRILRKIQAMRAKKSHPPVWIQEQASFAPTPAMLHVVPEAQIALSLMMDTAFDHPEFFQCIGALAGMFYEVIEVANGYRLRIGDIQAHQQFTITEQPDAGIVICGPATDIYALTAQLTVAYLEAYPFSKMILTPSVGQIATLKTALEQQAAHIAGGRIYIQSEETLWGLSIQGGVAQWTLADTLLARARR